MEKSSSSLTREIQNSEVTETVRDRTVKFFGKVKDAGDSTVKNSHILKIRAEITLHERDISKLKNQFGVELFNLMDRNRNMGNISGGEAEPELVEIFTQCTNNVTALLELRKRKQTELLQIIKPKAICYQGDEKEDDMSSLSDVIDSDSEIEGDVAGDFSNTVQLSFQKGINFFKNSLEKTQVKNTLRGEINELDKDLQARKEAFGVEMYEVMEYLGENYTPRDDGIKSLYESFKKQIDVPLLKLLTAEKELEDVRTTGLVLTSREEIKDYVEENPALWAMLDAVLPVGEDQCKLISVRVIIQLMTGLFGAQAKDAVLKKRDFVRFENDYVKNPRGSKEFFHRCVFSSFDIDNDGKLKKKEAISFLDKFYASGSVLHGSTRLPEKKDLKKLIKGFEGDKLTFDEITTLIIQSSGGDEKDGVLGLGIKVQIAI